MNGPDASHPSPGTPRPVQGVAVPRRLADLQKTITMAQIAKAAGVSQGAISSLLNDRDYGIRVSDKTKERVFRVCREMGYIPNDLRAVVRMYPELGDFCILAADGEFVGGMANGGICRVLSVALQESGPYSVTVGSYSSGLDYGDPQTLPPAVAAGVASKFLLAGPANPSLARALIQKGLPICWLGGDLPMEGIRCFLSDIQAACRQAMDWLRNAGHSRILLFSDPPSAPSSSFLNAGSGLRWDPSGHHGEPGVAAVASCGSTLEAGIQSHETFLRSELKPTAAVFFNDSAASGFALAARMAGSQTPPAVVSLDGQSPADLRPGRVSFLRAPVEKMVSEALRWVSSASTTGALNESGKQVYPHTWEPAPGCEGRA